MSAIAFLLSLVAFFILKGKSSMLDRVSPLILTPLLFGVFWVEAIFHIYDDTESARLLLNLIATFALIGSISFSIYWMKNAKLIYEKEETRLT